MLEKEKHNCLNLNQTEEHIEKYGLSVVMIEATEYLPSFAYSVGLWKTFGHSEIICFGLNTQTLHGIINDVAELIKSGEKIKTNFQYKSIFRDSRAEFLTVDKRNVEDYFGVAINYYETIEIPVLQLIWTDRNDKFPWELNFEEKFKHSQPLLDRNTEFKFKEEKNLAIFTTRQWLENEPIVRVVHDYDGDWQFLTDDFGDEDCKIVALEQMVIRDKTLNEVFDLEYGEVAERELIGGNWMRTRIENEEKSH